MVTTRNRILYVDDDIDNCNAMQVWLSSRDDSYNVTAVTSAEDAIALFMPRSFDIYVLDYCLPGMSGVELCRVIRRYYPETPILIYSAMDRPVDRERAQAAGADFYLVKPDDFDSIEPWIARLLGRSVSSRPRQSRYEHRATRNIL